jgi:truncated hemoglobin YjbI
MNTLYEKIGEAEGIKILVEKMASKMLVDPDLKNRIEKID